MSFVDKMSSKIYKAEHCVTAYSVPAHRSLITFCRDRQSGQTVQLGYTVQNLVWLSRHMFALNNFCCLREFDRRTIAKSKQNRKLYTLPI